jgi:serine/threonine protein phosphatase PrpC
VGASQRPENQDNYLLIDAAGQAEFLLREQPQRRNVPGWQAGHLRLAVLDGMGGHGHGREVAEAAVLGLLDMPPCQSVAELSERLDSLHRMLQRAFAGADLPERRPGTTLTMLELPPQGPALLYHVGDSRLYEIGPDHLAPLTVDHVPATTFLLNGLLSEQEWRHQVHGEHRPQIAQAFVLGNALTDPLTLYPALRPLTRAVLPPFLAGLEDRRVIELEGGRSYLLATDGLWSCAEPAQWVAHWPQWMGGAASAQAGLDRLFAEFDMRPPHGLVPDNLTALLIRLVGNNHEGEQ